MDGVLSPVRLLKADDGCDEFRSGSEELDAWLRDRAYANLVAKASTTYVACAGRRVAGYYCIASSAIFHAQSTGAVRRNMPEPVPATIMGRLAVDRDYQGQGLGGALVLDALGRAREAAKYLASRAFVVRAKDQRAAAFYRNMGFQPSPLDPLLLMLKM